jgi:hypothetical protein
MIKFPKTSRGKIKTINTEITQNELDFLKSIAEKVYTNWQGQLIIEYGRWLNIIRVD